MTKRSKRSPVSKPARTRSTPTLPWALVAVVVVLVAGGAAWWFLGRPVQRREAPAAPALPDSITSLPPLEATRIAMRLIDEDRPYEALLYLRHSSQFPGLTWSFYVNYATALHNSAMMGPPRDGRVDPVLRSSFERVAAMREAMRHFDNAERMAVAPADKAMVCYRRANALAVWGFPHDAHESYSRASRYDPNWRDVWGSYTDLVLHPTLVRVELR